MRVYVMLTFLPVFCVVFRNGLQVVICFVFHLFSFFSLSHTLSSVSGIRRTVNEVGTGWKFGGSVVFIQLLFSRCISPYFFQLFPRSFDFLANHKKKRGSTDSGMVGWLPGWLAA
ncbi:hypothetical protein B0J18DRAFT_43042 [Chaetomium sp. MPI-SDFR-AT-0129]|nr:hypothetical protein B0J18DRAFT_43042 [Chaetomium sp. MPI-SDFR-AT-0129]